MEPAEQMRMRFVAPVEYPPIRKGRRVSQSIEERDPLRKTENLLIPLSHHIACACPNVARDKKREHAVIQCKKRAPVLRLPRIREQDIILSSKILVRRYLSRVIAVVLMAAESTLPALPKSIMLIIHIMPEKAYPSSDTIV
jgi:hypothetical protein